MVKRYGPSIKAYAKKIWKAAKDYLKSPKLGLGIEIVRKAGKPAFPIFKYAPKHKLSRKNLAKIKEQVPEIGPILQYLTTAEKNILNKRRAQKLVEVWNKIADFRQDAPSIALAGSVKKGWYQRSAIALIDIFGPNDSIRMAALLAALSPQTSPFKKE